MSGLLQDETLDPTEDNIEGPYYLSNAPFRTRVHEQRDAGTVWVFAGIVKARNGKPLSGAILEIWQADPTGAYDWDGDPDHAPAPEKYRYRVRIKSGEKGEYSFETLRPGRYKLTETRYRPAHIHLKASHPGHRSLTTQIYFKDDPFNKVDPWYKASLAVTPKEEGKKLHATFDVILRKS